MHGRGRARLSTNANNETVAEPRAAEQPRVVREFPESRRRNATPGDMGQMSRSPSPSTSALSPPRRPNHSRESAFEPPFLRAPSWRVRDLDRSTASRDLGGHDD